ncbi:MAG: 7-cyano-7-deazaguanine synthase QueC [Calothrix sp. SM1_5_4]|nr:7-cyano-7-deazaguanine synthase QueC [Calothrix sp. SM1_5_4]
MSSSPKAIVLLSGGLDSTYNLFKAVRQLKVARTLTFNYGQKAAGKEIETARRLSSDLGVAHQVVELPWFRDFTHTALVASGVEVPSGVEVRIDSVEHSLRTAKSVWVPNRNGILLNIAAGFAEGLGAQYVIPGFNLEEAQTFPDNTDAFLRSLDQAFSYSTASRVRTQCFSVHLDKGQIVAEGKALGLPFARLWPCYFAGDKWCGRCESCQRYARALAANGLSFEELREV